MLHGLLRATTVAPGPVSAAKPPKVGGKTAMTGQELRHMIAQGKPCAHQSAPNVREEPECFPAIRGRRPFLLPETDGLLFDFVRSAAADVLGLDDQPADCHTLCSPQPIFGHAFVQSSAVRFRDEVTPRGSRTPGNRLDQTTIDEFHRPVVQPPPRRGDSPNGSGQFFYSVSRLLAVSRYA